MTIVAKLDARPDRIDLRDKEYSPPLRSLDHTYPPSGVLEEALPLYLDHELILDQGDEGACTGFGLAATINFINWRRAVLEVTPNGETKVNREATAPKLVSMRMLYHLARLYDEWPGEDYQGSSCRGAIKAWFKHGVCSDEVWPYRKNTRSKPAFISPLSNWQEEAAQRPLGVYYRIEKNSITDMQAAIQEVGAIYCSASVHSDWDSPSESVQIGGFTVPKISWQKGDRQTGGHAFSLVGYSEFGFIVQNSWGTKWGKNGFAVLTYEDWVENGSDAWVCVLGAKTRTRMPNHYVSSSIYRGREALEKNALLSNMVEPRPTDKTTQTVWNDSQAYAHSVVMGNDGKVINRLIDIEDGPSAVNKVLVDNAKDFFKARTNKPPRIVIYAHGGLNSEGASLERIKVLGPYFESNHIYPVFFTWKTGALESLGSILEDAASRMFPSSGGLEDLIDKAKDKMIEALDRTIEVGSEHLGVKAIWSQMKQNAAAASMKANNDRGAFLTSSALNSLLKEIPNLEVHFVGHSAGSIILGHMLDDLHRYKLPVTSCSLYAPACSIDFALRYYKKAVERTVLQKNRLHVHLLSDNKELDDTVGPYQKSLLYLISRALEDQHKTPLMGLAAAYDPKTLSPEFGYDSWYPGCRSALKKWQAFWGNSELDTVSKDEITTVGTWSNGQLVSSQKTVDSAHGSFDNDVEVVHRTIARIVGTKSLNQPVENLDY